MLIKFWSIKTISFSITRKNIGHVKGKKQRNEFLFYKINGTFSWSLKINLWYNITKVKLSHRFIYTSKRIYLNPYSIFSPIFHNKINLYERYVLLLDLINFSTRQSSINIKVWYLDTQSLLLYFVSSRLNLHKYVITENYKSIIFSMRYII